AAGVAEVARLQTSTGTGLKSGDFSYAGLRTGTLLLARRGLLHLRVVEQVLLPLLGERPQVHAPPAAARPAGRRARGDVVGVPLERLERVELAGVRLDLLLDQLAVLRDDRAELLPV